MWAGSQWLLTLTIICRRFVISVRKRFRAVLTEITQFMLQGKDACEGCIPSEEVAVNHKHDVSLCCYTQLRAL